MPRNRTPRPDPADLATRTTVSWFPGHMHKAQKRLGAEIAHADVVLEVRDARLPTHSGNPALAELCGDKPRLLLLNKASLADPAELKRWVEHFEHSGLPCLALDADTRKALNLIYPALAPLTDPARERFQRRGMRPPPHRLMIVGMPNVGKSTLINRIVDKKRLKTAPTPGVTRNISWVPFRDRYLLMDSPGIMLPRLEDEAAAQRLGWIGAIRDSVFGIHRLGSSLADHLLAHFPQRIPTAYKITYPDDATTDAVLTAICEARGYFTSGRAPNLTQAAELLLLDFRAGRLGRFTLETPPA